MAGTSFHTSQGIGIKTTPIKDDYDISTNVLGDGLNGKVVECTKRDTGVKFALKVLKDDPDGRREVELHRRAGVCERIVSIIDIYSNHQEGKKCLFLVMECMEGGELFDKIPWTGFSEQEAAKLMEDICIAVKSLHDMNIAHRDLKPENLLFTKKENGVLKLGDFGFAKETRKGPLRSPCHTPYYVAPEVLKNSNYSKRCDIWSLGVTMFMLIYGHPPFFSNQQSPFSSSMKTRIELGSYTFPQDLGEKVSEDAKGLIRSMLKKDPNDRPNIDQILSHKWFGNFRDEPLLKPITPQETKKRENEFSEEKFKLARDRVLAGYRAEVAKHKRPVFIAEIPKVLPTIRKRQKGRHRYTSVKTGVNANRFLKRR